MMFRSSGVEKFNMVDATKKKFNSSSVVSVKHNIVRNHTSKKTELCKIDSSSLLIDDIVMVKVFKDYSFFFHFKCKNKTSNMNSF